MMDLLLKMGLSNACFSLALAIVAMLVGAKAKRPHLAHLLWLLVFVKLVTPPILTIPVGVFPAQPGQSAVVTDHSATVTESAVSDEATSVSSLSSGIGTIALRAKPWLASIWLLGIAVVLGWSLVRVYRFNRLLATESETAPEELQTAAAKMAQRLGLNAAPMICTTSAHLSPMVWWMGGRVRVVVPTALLDRMDAQQSQWILAHELAHVRRRDYLVRWLEWLTCVIFWWNPVVWWAQRNLRAMEEICCDDLVISSLNPEPKHYANSLLSTVEFLARPVLRAPAVASEINSGGFLERRFKMIVSANTNRSNSRRWQFGVLLAALVILPLGLASAQDYEAVGKRLREAVAAGELTGEQARTMMGALRRAGAGKEKGADRAKAYLMRVRKELGEAVEAGEISEEDAVKRYKAAERRIRERMAARDRRRGARRITVEEYKRAEAEMRKMIEDGKAKPEDVERRLIEMRKMIGEPDKRDERHLNREDYGRIETELKKAVAEGRISSEDMRARLEGMRGEMAAQREHGRGDEGRRLSRDDWENIENRIESAVKSGEITREQADARYKAIRERMAQDARGGDKRADYEGVERRIKAAVEAGKMTREEAAEKLEAYKKRMGQEK